MSGMPETRVARTRGELTDALLELRGPGDRLPEHGWVSYSSRAAPQRTIAFVATMGALHDGHISLIRRARELADAVVVSIFVNPLQFGPDEDFERYPRAFGDDLDACRAEGVAVVFAPTREVVYPEDPVVRVNAGVMGQRLEGASRPGHFDGVLTVVLKLFQLIRPDVAVFGQKDAQQLALVRRMVRDLDIGVEVVAGMTVRDSDGLAISSRNAYLSAGQRATALALSRALRAGAAAVSGGPAAILRAGRDILAREPELHLDYLALVDPETFAEVSPSHHGPATLAVAARTGDVHFIDNTPLTIPSGRLEGSSTCS